MRSLILLVAILQACQSLSDQAGPVSHQLVSKVDSLAFYSSGLNCPASVSTFYRQRQGDLFWFAEGKASVAVDTMVSIIDGAAMLGLLPSDYHSEGIGRVKNDSVNLQIALLDVLLTDAFITLYDHLKRGRMEPELLMRRDLSREILHDAIKILGTANGDNIRKLLTSAEPVLPQYQALRYELSELLAEGCAGLCEDRARTIALNLERWRWRRDIPARYIFVNIPSYTLKVFENDSVWLRSKVIVGKRETPTPVLQSIIRSFIIYPYWHAPQSIATKEILPHLQDDPFYLLKNNFEVLDRGGAVIKWDTISWMRYNPQFFPFILRQREGSENSMGIIKFNFSNRYGVYLHDTNSKRLYQRARRDLSHGCVRVMSAVELARYLVREDDIYVSPEDLDQYLDIQQRLQIDLRKPIPVILDYFTAEVDGDSLQIFEDIYRKDSLMNAALQPLGQIAGL